MCKSLWIFTKCWCKGHTAVVLYNKPFMIHLKRSILPRKMRIFVTIKFVKLNLYNLWIKWHVKCVMRIHSSIGRTSITLPIFTNDTAEKRKICNKKSGFCHICYFSTYERVPFAVRRSMKQWRSMHMRVSDVFIICTFPGACDGGDVIRFHTWNNHLRSVRAAAVNARRADFPLSTWFESFSRGTIMSG